MPRKANHNCPPPAVAPNPGGDPSTPARRQPVILKDPIRPAARFAEVAGGTAAGCAATCCCCPCGLVNLLVLTLVRLPAALCKKALKKQRMKRRVAVAGAGKKCGLGAEKATGDAMRPAMVASEAVEGWPERPSAAEMAEMERKVWAEFCSTGFWRSPSQREER